MARYNFQSLRPTTTALPPVNCPHSYCQFKIPMIVVAVIVLLFLSCASIYAFIFFCQLLNKILHKICTRRVDDIQRGDLVRISVERDESSIQQENYAMAWEFMNKIPRIREDRLNEVMPPVQYKSSNRRRSRRDDCAICLEDFKDGEQCRLLPQCNHMFHVSCIDTWLTSNNSTCPICRQFVQGSPSTSIH